MNEPGESEERKKARIVAQAVGSRDRDKKMLMTYCPTVNRSSIKLMLAVAAGKNIPIFTRDIGQARVSTSATVQRDTYLVPMKELNLDPEVLCKVMELIHGLPESGVHLFETYAQHNVEKLSMTATEVDPCLLYRTHKQWKLDGITCLQVDKAITAGSKKFCEEEEEASNSFMPTGHNFINDGSAIKFNGQHIGRR